MMEVETLENNDRVLKIFCVSLSPSSPGGIRGVEVLTVEAPQVQLSGSKVKRVRVCERQIEGESEEVHNKPIQTVASYKWVVQRAAHKLAV